MNPVLTLAIAFWRLCLLRVAPQDIPESRVLTGLAVAAHLSFGVVLGLIALPGTRGISSGILDTLLLALFAFAALAPFGHARRLPQTLTALTGSGAVLSLIAIPFAAWYQLAGPGTPDSAGPALILLLMTIWSVAVVAHVMRHAVSASFGFGMLLAVVWLIVSWTAFDLLIGAPG